MSHKRNQYLILLTCAAAVVVAAGVLVYHGRQVNHVSQDAVSKRPQSSQPAAKPVQASGTAPVASKLSPASQPAASSGSASAPVVVATHGLALFTSNTNPTAGDEVAVSLYENSGSEPVNAVQAELKYDSSAFSYLRVDPPTDFSLEAATDTTTVGVIRLARAATGTPLTGQHLVATLHFKIAGAASDSQTIGLSNGGSYIIRAADSANILQTVTAATLTIRK